MWERVVDKYEEYTVEHLRLSRDQASVKRQWQAMLAHPKPTGDPHCPDYIVRAKRINREINNEIGLIEMDDGENTMEPEDDNDNNNEEDTL